MSVRIERQPVPTPAAPRPAARRGFSLVELMVVVAVIALLIALLLPATRSARPAARRAQCQNNLKNIALAILAYQGEHGALPPAYTVDPAGRRLHSWRTLILPHLDQGDVYRSNDLSKPWDDPANAEARAVRLSIFRCPEASRAEGATRYLASVGPDAALAPDRARPLSEITDGHGSTLLVIESGDEDAVHWMSPNDVAEALITKISAEPELPHNGSVNAAFLDGGVRFLRATTPLEVRRALTTIAGGDDAAVEDLYPARPLPPARPPR
ncbi:DUF1559 family PulG-like putative transporter [Paludisphaera soli]|uniref:DUF1559 family PulG-like putative transporter n=1 Tax=Paludisphaera soli TaxID=2712865 RepID=UPI0013ED93B6|nr:DUF1559 domain-containing protein [Paludisphaera soli]